MCAFNSLSYSCISWSCGLDLFLWNLRTDISDPFEDYRAKGNILWTKWEGSCLRNFFVICEFISQSYSFPLKKSFTKTVLVEFWKWYLETHGGLWWKRKYLQIKTGKKLFRNCLVICEFTTHSYNFPLKKPFAKTVLVEYAKGYLEAPGGLWWKGKYPQIKTGKKLSEKRLCVLWIHLSELQVSPPEAIC